ncbi:MAG: hypothetical protein Q7T04_05920 [Dehalococcoidia bacterium]|nr:hypothetical protein [Dehalococcoidia bacterium]
MAVTTAIGTRVNEGGEAAMFLTLVPLLLASRAKPAPVHTGPGREFTLVPGQVANVEGEHIAIEFVNVVVDSRRSLADPSGCDGEVSCLILMTDLAPRARPYRGLLTQSGHAGRPEI